MQIEKGHVMLYRCVVRELAPREGRVGGFKEVHPPSILPQPHPDTTRGQCHAYPYQGSDSP